jgi:hypothetical protein
MPNKISFKKLVVPSLLALALFLPWAAWTQTATKFKKTVKDRFGISILNVSANQGRQWYCQWGNGHARTLKWQIDPDDSEFDVNHGDATFEIDGKGVCKASGRTPRMYVYDHTGKQQWGNVEITLYGMRVSETKSLGYAGLMAYARTNHTKDENICDDRGYGGRLTYDGRADFEKEIAHHLGAGYVQAAEVHPWEKDGPMPRNVWIGYKFIVYNVDGGKHVRMEIWRDMTDGKNGGQWELLTSYVDQGGWGTKAPPCASGVDPAAILTNPNLVVYVRTDEVSDMRYKNFSIREIDPSLNSSGY